MTLVCYGRVLEAGTHERLVQDPDGAYSKGEAAAGIKYPPLFKAKSCQLVQPTTVVNQGLRGQSHIHIFLPARGVSSCARRCYITCVRDSIRMSRVSGPIMQPSRRPLGPCTDPDLLLYTRSRQSYLLSSRWTRDFTRLYHTLTMIYILQRGMPPLPAIRIPGSSSSLARLNDGVIQVHANMWK
jgi:hypothetical protein